MNFEELLNQGEQVLPIEGYANYVVTNHGRVISLKGHPKILKPATNRGGYQYVSLYINGKAKYFYVHRLVAKAFLSNPNNLPEVNHKDEVKTNNHASNLEWCTSKYNNNYGTRNLKVAEAQINGKKSKPVGQYTKSGELVKVWPSTREAERGGGFDHQNIVACCKDRLKSHAGFAWKYC